MSELYFWNQWKKPYRIIYLILLVLFALAVLGLLFSIIWGNQISFSWDVVNQYSPINLPLKSIDLVLAEVYPEVEHYVLEQTFKGSPIQMFPQIYVTLAVLSLLLISILIAVLTAFPRFWYLIGMTVVALIFVGLRLEQVMLFNSTENIGLYIALLLYFPLSFYFHSINNLVPLYNRIFSFIGVSLLFGVLIHVFANVAHPFLYIGTYGILVPIALSFIFILLVAHDIISGFLFLVTGSNTSMSKNSLLHFSVITLIYLGWLLITYFNNINSLHWDVIYINSAALLLISAIVGIYGFRERCGVAYTFLPFQPFGAILYLSLGTICLATLSTFYLIANDPMLGMFEDFIIFSHMGIGLMFFIYIIANFSGILKKNLNVFRIQYKPLNLPYFITAVGGIILIVVLVAKSLMYPYHQAFAGYYNGLGDLFALDKQVFLSEQYYKLGRSYDLNNYRSNYSLASLAMKQGDEAVALKYFDDAMTRLPDAHAFVNVANIYRNKGRFFDALFILSEGLQRFPGEAHVQNNLANLFAKTSVLDSAAYYLERARGVEDTKEVAEVNLMKLAVSSGIAIEKDSLLRHLEVARNQQLLNNALVYFNLNQQNFPRLEELDIDIKRSNLGPEDFTFWHEYALNELQHQSGEPLNAILSGIAHDSTNNRFYAELLFVAGISEYYENKVGQAFQTFQDLTMTASSRTGYFNYLKGLWALEQRAYYLAADYFNAAFSDGYEQGAYPMAFALTATGNTDEALSYWEMAAKESSEVSANSAALVMEWMRDSLNLEKQNDNDAFFKILFNKSTNVPDLLEEASGIENDAMQLEAWLVILEKALEGNNLTGIPSLIALLERRKINEDLLKKFDQLRFEYWLSSGQIDKAENFLRDSSTLATYANTPQLILFKAKKEELATNLSVAEEYYKQLATLNPFFEVGVIAAAEFYNKTSEDKEQAYQVLLGALRTNPYSASLQKAYIMQSLEMHLTSYAENNLQNLEQVLTAADYQEFLAEYNQKRDSLEHQAQWE